MRHRRRGLYTWFERLINTEFITLKKERTHLSGVRSFFKKSLLYTHNTKCTGASMTCNYTTCFNPDNFFKAHGSGFII